MHRGKARAANQEGREPEWTARERREAHSVEKARAEGRGTTLSMGARERMRR